MIELDEHTRFTLRQMQRREKDRRRLIRITVIRMLDGGISVEDICYTFGIDDSTVYRYAERRCQAADAPGLRRQVDPAAFGEDRGTARVQRAVRCAHPE